MLLYIYHWHKGELKKKEGEFYSIFYNSSFTIPFLISWLTVLSYLFYLGS